jgi:hypothetical protein
MEGTTPGRICLEDAPGTDMGVPDPGSGVVRLLAGLLGAAVLLALLGLAWWSLVPSVPPPPPLPDRAAAAPVTIETAMPLLQEQAETWLPGAAPTSLGMQIDWPWGRAQLADGQLPVGGWITAVFAAPWDAPAGRRAEAATLSLLLDRGSGRIADQDALAWETPPRLPGPWAAPAVGSVEATLAAEEAGGAEFRLACPEVRHISRTHWIDRDGVPVWRVIYEDSRAPDRGGYTVEIDAATGEVRSADEDIGPCPGVEPAG